MVHKGESLSLGLVLVCLLIAPIYVLNLLGIPLSLTTALFSGSQAVLFPAVGFLIAEVLLTFLIAGLYHRSRIALVVFVLFYPLYVTIGVPSITDSKFHSPLLVPLLVSYSLTMLAGGIYARELGFIGRR